MSGIINVGQALVNDKYDNFDFRTLDPNQSAEVLDVRPAAEGDSPEAEVRRTAAGRVSREYPEPDF